MVTPGGRELDGRAPPLLKIGGTISGWLAALAAILVCFLLLSSSVAVLWAPEPPPELPLSAP